MKGQDIFILTIIITIIVVLIYAFCTDNFKKQVSYKELSCNTALDTILIRENWNRGYLRVGDSLVIDVSLPAFDDSQCDSLDLMTTPIFRSKKTVECRLGDLYPPYLLTKHFDSDTLIAIKDKRIIYFKIHDWLCQVRI